jgi:hypothetical protein
VFAPGNPASRTIWRIQDPEIANPPWKAGCISAVRPGKSRDRNPRFTRNRRPVNRYFRDGANSRRFYGPFTSGRLLFRNRKGNYMPRLRTRTCRKPREKVFRKKPGIPLDRNAKARIIAYADGYNAKHRRKGQHRGPITWAFLRVLRAILYGFHNEHTGHCFPSYESIADKADCHRDTVYEAIRALEDSGILDWVNRFDKIYKDRWQVVRVSNAYLFRDPLPCATSSEIYKSENPAGTLHQEKILTNAPPKIIVLDPQNSCDATLISLGRTLGAIAA